MAYIDYYKILGVEKTATQAQIKTAYRKLARKNHPDLNANDVDAEKRFKEINEANEVLSNTKNRTKYDTHGSNWKRAAGQNYQRSSGDFSDFFESMFRNSGGQDQNAELKGRNQNVAATLNLTDVLKSVKRTLGIRGEAVEFMVPSGIRDGQILTVPEKGGEGVNGGPRGDLLVNFKIINNTNFKRDGDDLHLDCELDLFTALLGGEVTTETLLGTEKIEIKPGTQNGEQVSLEGKGMPLYNDDEQFGNFIVTFNVRLPENLTKKEKELFEEIEALRSSQTEKSTANS